MSEILISVDDVKRFGKIEYGGDDETVEFCLNAAVDMLKSAGVVSRSSGLYKMAVCRLALHYYENREELSNFNQVPLGINTMIEQLRNTDEEVI